MLFKYITTVYDNESSWLMKISKKFIGDDNTKRANSRKCSTLSSDQDVLQFYEFFGLLQLLLLRLDKKKIIYNWLSRYLSDEFGKKVANYAIKQNVDAVIMYDTNASTCFQILKAKAHNIIRIIDVSAANRL